MTLVVPMMLDGVQELQLVSLINLLLWTWRLIADCETWQPLGSTKLCNSETVSFMCIGHYALASNSWQLLQTFFFFKLLGIYYIKYLTAGCIFCSESSMISLCWWITNGFYMCNLIFMLKGKQKWSKDCCCPSLRTGTVAIWSVL